MYLPFARKRHMVRKVGRVQRICRGWEGRRHLERQMQAAASIQSLQRLVWARQHVARKKKAVAVLQAGVDSMQKKRLYAKRRQQMVNFQAIIRGSQTRRRFQEKRDAAANIARLFRGSKVRQRHGKLVAASFMITTSVRAWLARLRFQRAKQSAAKLQVAWRKALAHARVKEQGESVTRIARAWRAFRDRHHHKRVRMAGALIVSAAFMWKHMRIKTEKTSTATRVGAAWRGYCVRKNLVALRKNASRISEWWRKRKLKQEVLWDIFEIGVAKRELRIEYLAQHAVLIQRNLRRWLRWRHGMYRVKRMVLSMQSRYRSWGPKQHVALLRAVMGPHVKRFPSQLVALAPDKRGKFTRYRAFRAKERVCPHVARIVRLKVLPLDFRDTLSEVVGKIQAFLKHRLRFKRLRAIQKVARGWLCRLRMQRREVAAQRIQRTVRKMFANSDELPSQPTEHRCKRRAAILIQAHARGLLVRALYRMKVSGKLGIQTEQQETAQIIG
jgi:hypothetical protein